MAVNESGTKQYTPEEYGTYAPIYRDLINQENARWNERMTWLLQSQALLFASIALGWEKDPMLVCLLAGVGIASSYTIGRFLRNAITTIEGYIDEWDDRAHDYKGPKLTGGIRKDGRADKADWRHPTIMMPHMFILAWLLLLLVRLTPTLRSV